MLIFQFASSVSKGDTLLVEAVARWPYMYLACVVQDVGGTYTLCSSGKELFAAQQLG